ncbi:hypothetical protein D0Z00_003409 [Geotrichum galactomycetum]|uniref:Uncharacterized protein n=1 Tax=Geotrichum galactomycetum TaxID=27317 RepID=A0ACB6V1A7_9ASCO|nr:hypothetical protein D0Z00_003409 [Geotrichum candidum]
MRFNSLISLAVATFSAAVTVASSADSGIQEKPEVTKLLMEASGQAIQLTDKTFETVVNGPRDYDLILLLTAVDMRFGCQFCRALEPEFDIIANSWHGQQSKGTHGGLVFAIADLSHTPDAFKNLKLTHAPNLWVYPKTNDQSAHYSRGYEVYKFPQQPEQAEPLADYIHHTLGHNIIIQKPFPMDKLIFTIISVAAAILFIRVYFSKILNLLQAKKLWVAVSMVSVLLFTAGHMYNAIRKVPYVAGDGQGGIAYFVGGHSNQVAIETQIVAMLYAVLSFSTVMLVTKVPALKDPKKQLLLVVALSAVIFFAYSFLIAKFHIKNGGYPFWLLRL